MSSCAVCCCLAWGNGARDTNRSLLALRSRTSQHVYDQLQEGRPGARHCAPPPHLDSRRAPTFGLIPPAPAGAAGLAVAHLPPQPGVAPTALDPLPPPAAARAAVARGTGHHRRAAHATDLRRCAGTRTRDGRRWPERGRRAAGLAGPAPCEPAERREPGRAADAPAQRAERAAERHRRVRQRSEVVGHECAVHAGTNCDCRRLGCQKRISTVIGPAPAGHTLNQQLAGSGQSLSAASCLSSSYMLSWTPTRRIYSRSRWSPPIFRAGERLVIAYRR